MIQPNLARGFRRIVTGNDADGRSRIADDRLITEGRAGNHDIWSSPAQDTASNEAELLRGQRFYPPHGEVYFRFFRIPAESPTLTREAFDAIATDLFGGFGIPEVRVDTSRHPMMHVTPTIDFVVLLSGKISLLLDAGDAVELEPFDTVVQRATNHAWVNHGPEDAILMAVMKRSS